MVKIPTKTLKLGDKNAEVQNLNDYLKRFGYMKSERTEISGYKIDLNKAADQAEQDDNFDTNTKTALRKFQEFNKLPITETLDNQTLALMSKPRCGVPDFVTGEQVDYVIVGKWNTINLSYRFENFTADLGANILRRAVSDGLNQWRAWAALNFSLVETGENIRIRWAQGDHGDGNPFDGPGSVLAHAFFPSDGRVHFDDAENWTDNNPPTGTDFASVALHEFGHTLGLGHSSDTNAVMYAFYLGIRRNVRYDDILGIQKNYGPSAKVATAPGALLREGPPKFFVGTADGRLLERYWDQGRNQWFWTDHGLPPGTRVATAAGAVLNPPGPPKFFVGTADGRLFERYWDQGRNNWFWTDHGLPPGTTVAANTTPGPVLREGPPKFFVGTADGRLFERYWDQGRNNWFWTDHGLPPGTRVATAAGPLLHEGPPKFFVGTADGRLFERYWDQGRNQWFWTDHGLPPGTRVATAAGALLNPPGPPKFFVGTADGRLFERYWDQGRNNWFWTDHGLPPGTTVARAPGALLHVGPPKFFLHTADGRLFERYWDQGRNNWFWTDHGLPPGTAVGSIPGALLNPPEPSKFFLRATDGRLFERYWDQGRNNWFWTDHITPPRAR